MELAIDRPACTTTLDLVYLATDALRLRASYVRVVEEAMDGSDRYGPSHPFIDGERASEPAVHVVGLAASVTQFGVRRPGWTLPGQLAVHARHRARRDGSRR